MGLIPAVVYACDREGCDYMSDAVNPQRAEQLRGWHEADHERRDRRERHPDHLITSTYTSYECDDMSGYLTCSCGWVSRTVHSCWWSEEMDGHLREVEARS